MSNDANNKLGPNTDVLGSDYRASDNTHLTEFSPNGSHQNGLTTLAQYWYDKLSTANLSPTLAKLPVPITVTIDGSNRIISVPPGLGQYYWGNDINSISPGSNSITTSIGSGSIRCFIKDGFGNWIITPSALMNCPSCRQGIDSSPGIEDEPLKFTVYPNPFFQSLTVEFETVQPNSQVSLDIIDAKGQVVKTIVNSVHDIGRWKYPVSISNIPKNSIYFCRLKINGLSTTRKILAADQE